VSVDTAPDQPKSGGMPAEPAPRPGTASVLAGVVARGPGPALEAVLASLAAQDHARLEVLVVDAGPAAGHDQMVEGVGRFLPGSTIAVLDGTPGLGASVAAGLTARTSGPPPRFLLILGDDVVANDTAVRRMVERAVEANLGIVGAKVLGPGESRSLDDFGASVDRLGTRVPLVEPDEVDQGQYDTRRDVLSVASGAVLVRTDLYEALGGLDPEVVDGDAVLELCWRARLVGASVSTVPTAVAHRLELVGDRAAERSASSRRARHRLRRVLVCHRPARAATAVLGILGATVLGVFYGALTGRFRYARALLGALPWNLQRLSSAGRRRRRLPTPEPAVEAYLTRLEVPHRAFRRVVTGRALTGTDDRSPAQLRLHRLWSMLLGPGGLALMVSAAVLGFGSRALFRDGLPAVGRFQPLPTDPTDLVRSWWLGWRPTGTGTTVVGPDGLALLGLADGLWPWATGLLWTLVVLAALPTGAVGMWRLVRPVGGGRSRAVAVLVYLSVPLPYDALRAGRIGPLAAYAIVPWLVRRLVGAQGVAPYGGRGGDPGPGTRLRSLWSDVLVTGLALAAAVVVEPVLVVPVGIVVVGLVVGTGLAGSLAGLARLATVGAGGFAVAALLHLPLLATLLGDRTVDSLVEPIAWPVHGLGTDAMFRLETGDFGLGRLGLALLVVPALALLVARGRHLALAIRAWFVVAASWSTVWVVDQGWWDGPTPEPGILLTPAAVGLAWAAAVGVASLGTDLLGEGASARSKRWLRQGAVGLVGLSLAIVVLPVLAGSIDGAWGTARDDLRSAVPFISRSPVDAETVHGGVPRAVWLGAPSVLPAAGIPLSDSPAFDGVLALAVTDGRPDLGDQWPLEPTEGMEAIRTAVSDAMNGDTSRLGTHLGLWGVGWVVLVDRAVPVPQPGVEVMVPDRLAGALSRQLDLERMEGLNRAVTVYRNLAVEAPLAVVRDRNRQAVPVAVTRQAFDQRVVTASADGALRWAVGPDRSWGFVVDGVGQPLVDPDEPGAVVDHPSVRVARDSVGLLVLDDDGSTGRRAVQVVLFGVVLLLASWARTAREVRR